MTSIPVQRIDTDIPMPGGRARPGPEPKYPLMSLEVGDSFSFPYDKRKTVQTRTYQIKRDTGREFAIRKADNNTARVWRTK